MKLELWQLQEQLEETPELKPICSFANDCSSEALTSLMAANDGVFSVLSTEGGIFDIMAGRYSNKFNIDVRAERPLWGCHLCGSNDPRSRVHHAPGTVSYPLYSTQCAG